MKLAVAVSGFVLACSSSCAMAQVSSLTDDELVKQTDRLKREKEYYDQLAATQSSRNASSADNATSRKEELEAELALRKVRLESDFLLADVLKSKGLTAAAGKEGKVTFVSAQATPLSMKASGLKLVSDLSGKACAQILVDLGTQKAFLAPNDYEQKVQAGARDVALFIALTSAADQGYADLSGGVNLQSALSAIGGGLAVAQYLGGGIESFSKLFRTDHSMTFGSADRAAFFEQQLSVRCRERVEVNMEERLRLSAAEVLSNGIERMAMFLQIYDSKEAKYKTETARLAAEIAEIKASKDLTDGQKDSRLQAPQLEMVKQNAIKLMLDQHKAAYDSAKALLGTDMKGVSEALVWGQQALIDKNVFPAHLAQVPVKGLARLTYSLAVEDGVMTSSAMFRSEKVRPVSTAELTYYLRDGNGKPLNAGYWAATLAGDTVKLSRLAFPGGNALASDPKEAQVTPAVSNAPTGVPPATSSNQRP